MAFGNLTFLRLKLKEKLTSRLKLTVKIEVDISCAFTTPETTLTPFKNKMKLSERILESHRRETISLLKWSGIELAPEGQKTTVSMTVT